ncbi:MAG: InlB B-repeat-containing protein [Gaiellales bacterium]
MRVSPRPLRLLILAALAATAFALTGGEALAQSASPTAPASTVTVRFHGAGAVTIQWPATPPASGHRTCTSTCTQAVPSGSVVQLIADSSPGQWFQTWAGQCAQAGTDDDCALTVRTPTTAQAFFTDSAPMATLTTSVGGTGGGGLTSSPSGIGCGFGVGGSCAASFLLGSIVQLDALPLLGSQLESWGGACSATKPSALLCLVTMSANQTAAVTYTQLVNPDVNPQPGPTPPGPSPGPTPPGPAPLPIPEPGPNPPSPYIGPTPGVPLAITGLRATKRAFKPRRGTRILYRLNQNADVTITFTKRLSKQKRIRYVLRLKAGRKGGDAGRNSIRIIGRVKGHDVRSGRWTMQVVARNATSSTKPQQRILRVLPVRRAR